MTPTRTPFAQLERLAPGDSITADGQKFTDEDRATVDRLLKLGAVTHRHDAHAALVDPTLAPVVVTSSPGGSIGADIALHVVYTLLDADGGESAPVAAVTITTPPGYVEPFDMVSATPDYLAGTLLAGNYGYAATVADGLGGETAIGPVALTTVEPGHANAEVAISGLTLLTNDASGSDPAATWRLWRQFEGGPWYLIATGSAATDAFTDNGVAGDCTIEPPAVGTTVGANQLSITVPGGQPADAVGFNVFVSRDGSFISPALLGTYPIADTGTPQLYTDLTVTSGAPPAVSTTIPGATLISGGGGLTWRDPVDTFADLPAVGNSPGDVRLVLDTFNLYVWDDAGSDWYLLTLSGGAANAGPFWPAPLPSTQQGADYTLQLSDQDSIVEFTSAGAVICTVPADATALFDVGAIIRLLQYGAGQVTVSPAVGVTLRSEGAKYNTAAQYAEVELRKRAADEWVLTGNRA